MYARYLITEDTVYRLKNTLKREVFCFLISMGREERYERNRDQNTYQDIIEKLPERGGTFKISQINEKWFPIPNQDKEQYDIFLSHSHKDDDEIYFIVGFFKFFLGLRCFVDSWEWGYIKDLQKEIDNKYCLKNNEYYNYELRNTTTSILNISLISSIYKAMDNIECAILIETGNSVLKNIGISRETLSPWIYAENIAMNMLRPHLDRASTISQESHKIGDGVAMDSLPEIRFSLENIPELSVDILDQIMFDKKRGKEVLDFFYAYNPSGSSSN